MTLTDLKIALASISLTIIYGFPLLFYYMTVADLLRSPSKREADLQSNWQIIMFVSAFIAILVIHHLSVNLLEAELWKK